MSVHPLLFCCGGPFLLLIHSASLLLPPYSSASRLGPFFFWRCCCRRGCHKKEGKTGPASCAREREREGEEDGRNGERKVEILDEKKKKTEGSAAVRCAAAGAIHHPSTNFSNFAPFPQRDSHSNSFDSSNIKPKYKLMTIEMILYNLNKLKSIKTM